MCAVHRMMCRWLTVQPPVTPASNCGIAAVELYSIIQLETRSFSKGSHNLHFYFCTAYGFTCKHILNYVRCDGAATAFSIEQKRALHSFVEREQCGNLNKATSTENRSVKCSHALSERECFCFSHSESVTWYAWPGGLMAWRRQKLHWFSNGKAAVAMYLYISF